MDSKKEAVLSVDKLLNSGSSGTDDNSYDVTVKQKRGSVARTDSLEVTRRRPPRLSDFRINEVEETEVTLCDDSAVVSEDEVQLTTIEPKEKKKWNSYFSMREISLKITVAISFVIIVTALAVIFHFYNRQQYEHFIGTQIHFNEMTRTLNVMNTSRQEVLRGHLGRKITDWKLPFDCTEGEGDFSELCLNWRDKARLQIKYHEENETNCYDVSWAMLNSDTFPEDCFELKWGSWYGGGIKANGIWPVENISLSETAFVPGSGLEEDSFGAVLEPYWLLSSGVGIYVHQGIPLSVSINEKIAQTNTSDGMICLYSDNQNPPFKKIYDRSPSLNYTVCVSESLRKVHDTMLDLISEKPAARPSDTLFKLPVWSTAVGLSNGLNETSLLDFLSHIHSHHYKIGTLLVDDRWEGEKGDFSFDSVRFPNPSSMIRDVASHGVVPYFNMHPYSSTESASFHVMINNEYYVCDVSGQAPGLVKLKRLSSHVPFPEVVGTLDLTPQAQQWLLDRVEAFESNFSVGACYFSGGEVDNLPYLATLAGQPANPGNYASGLNRLVSRACAGAIVESAYHSQSLGLSILLHGSTSTWDKKTGLKSIIPKVLTLGLIGYPFVIPDVIGGSGIPELPSKELLIRWLQLSTFLPVMHISIPPHAYDEDTVLIAKNMADLHWAVIAGKVISLAEEALISHHPIIRPLWWISPEDHQALITDSEFLIGNDILVAPILEEDARKRDIYLTKGQWHDELTGEFIDGPYWLREYPVPINKIAYFTRR